MARWSSRFGFLLATVGAAVGLGNIWRFSAVVGTNGGGAYLLPYLFAVFVLAVPLLVLELAVGRTLRTDVVSAFRAVGERYAVLGIAVVAGVVLVVSYYLVLTGWVLAFLLGALAGVERSFTALTAGWEPIVTFLVVTVLSGATVSLGVSDGIERLAKLVMPTVFLILLGLAVYVVTLPGWFPAVSFLFTPEFDVLADPRLWSAAFGQAFFSLSVGMGIMLTYGSYLDEGTDLLRSSVIVAAADVAVALVSGVVIFPIVFSYGFEPTLGTELAFVTLPAAFAAMPFGRVVAVAFFGLLFFAALTSVVSMVEVAVATLTSATSWDRPRATAVLTAGLCVLGLPSALSYSPVDLALGGRPVLDIVDESVGTFGLPISAVLIVAVFAWRWGETAPRRELGALWPLVRYVTPLVLLTATAMKAVGLARPAWRLLLDHARNGSSSALVGGLFGGAGLLPLLAVLLIGGAVTSVLGVVLWSRGILTTKRRQREGQ
jgi:NSS family neurotransmitter:Na+ symporter